MVVARSPATHGEVEDDVRSSRTISLPAPCVIVRASSPANHGLWVPDDQHVAPEVDHRGGIGRKSGLIVPGRSTRRTWPRARPSRELAALLTRTARSSRRSLTVCKPVDHEGHGEVEPVMTL